ncbi:peptide deformylase [Eubacteriales bacterium KG127]
MATRQIRIEGEDILRKVCRPVGEVTDRVRQHLADMLDTMEEEKGVGIAAPQVGIMRRMFIAKPFPDEDPYYMIDPEFISKEGETVDDEGCLSVPGMIGTVKRPQKIVMEATGIDGVRRQFTFEDFEARVMCHENDHLDGILYTDIATNIRRLEELEEDIITEDFGVTMDIPEEE